MWPWGARCIMALGTALSPRCDTASTNRRCSSGVQTKRARLASPPLLPPPASAAGGSSTLSVSTQSALSVFARGREARFALVLGG